MALFLVSTPIGNMNDITYRAVEVLKNCDLILSEDTRETDKVLKAYNISKSQISYRDQNHDKILPRVILELEQGKDICLVSDNGTPAISDPGFKLVSECVKRDYVVESVPGPSAVIAALSVSGLPTDKFIFLGFLPKSVSSRKKMLSEYTSHDATIIVYESPYRVLKLLKEINDVCGNRKVCLAKDLTKKHQEIKTDTIENLLKDLGDKKIKGEHVVLIAKKGF